MPHCVGQLVVPGGAQATQWNRIFFRTFSIGYASASAAARTHFPFYFRARLEILDNRSHLNGNRIFVAQRRSRLVLPSSFARNSGSAIANPSSVETRRSTRPPGSA